MKKPGYAQARTFMTQTGNPDQWGTAYPPEEMIRQDIMDGKSYVNLDGDHIRAVFYFAVEEDPTYSYIEGAWLNAGPYGVIHRIAVGESGKGVAAECFRYAFARCGNVRIDTDYAVEVLAQTMVTALPSSWCLRRISA